MEAMGNLPLNPRLAQGTSNRMGGVLPAPLLISAWISWLDRKLEAKLTPEGQTKYQSARGNYKVSNEIRDQLESSAVAGERVKKTGLTIEQFCRLLNEHSNWNSKRYDRVFLRGAFIVEREARLVCDTLQISFDERDWVTKSGMAPDWDWDSPSEIESKRKGFIEREARKDGEGDLEDREPNDTQQPCNPAALSAAVSQGSIPDLFDSSHFHLKVRVKETSKSSFKIREQDTGGEAPLSCWLLYSIYNGQYPFAKVSSSNNDKALNKDGFMTNDMDLEICCSTDPLYFHVVDPIPLIDAIGRLCNYVLALCRKHLSDNQLPLLPIVHLHLLLPVSWLSGPLPEAIRQGLKRQVFFCCSDRSTRNRLSGSAITQLHAQALRVNQSLHSGSALSSLRWSTVCGGDTQTVPLAQLFQSIPEVIHLSDCDLGIKTDYCELVGRDALLAAEHRFLFAEQFSGAGEGSAEDRMDQRWRRLVEIGLPLVIWWRDPGALAESARVDRLEAVLKGSWSEFCNALQHLEWSTNPAEQNNLAMNALLSNLGIFYEEPLRCIPPETFSL
jgi:hypothetical protein